MSFKRSRATYEAELQAEQSPFVVFGTPLPPLDPDVRDDGSYVPVWKQEVRDERGRRRLHGAFTGGWSAGYFNTVGSKEGWTPSTFVSSRANRRRDVPGAAAPRAEDFMDDEDLADAAEAQKLQTSGSFAGLGSTEHDAVRATAGLAGLFRVQGETMGARLLKKMGWREGQGVGPKVRRRARLDVRSRGSAGDAGDTYLFAPENVALVAFVRKLDHRGLGYEGEGRLAPLRRPAGRESSRWSDEDEDEGDGEESISRPAAGLLPKKKAEKKKAGGIGIGVLNDTGSDDEDPYEVGPRISYSRVVGGDKKKRKKKDGAGTTTSVNPAVRSKPVFIPKRSNLARIALGLRKCHDGRLPLDGFAFGQEPDPLIRDVDLEGHFPPPKMPPGWRSSKQPRPTSAPPPVVSTADAARASTLDPKSRAAMLGEQQLPGKSVFDFLSTAARDRLAAATGKTNLPPALGEIPAEYAMTAEQKLAALMKEVPQLDRETAAAALARGAGGGGPYGDNEAKRSRYRAYLENQAGLARALAARPAGTSGDGWLRELHEFYNCARIFRPMTGMMASRFTTSTSSSSTSSSANRGTGSRGQAADGGTDLVAKPAPKPKDPAEEAAKLGMFGQMTRSAQDFYPTRLLCKRFNVKPPAHVRPDGEGNAGGRDRPGGAATNGPLGGFDAAAAGFQMLDALVPVLAAPAVPAGVGEARQDAPAPAASPKGESGLDPNTNEALEGKRAGEEVFKAIFGDDSDEE